MYSDIFFRTFVSEKRGRPTTNQRVFYTVHDIQLKQTVMEKSKVFFTNLHTTPSSNLLDKMERLIKRAGIETIDFKDQFVAIKIHFGEPGNLAYLRPNYAARLANLLRSWGAKPFLTDCNTLYSGRRANAVAPWKTAITPSRPNAR